MAGQKEEEKEPKPGESSARVTDIILHVYDVTNSGNPKTNQAILQINRVMRDNLGIGGIFHGAVEVYGEEWSFGYCETGSGVFSCPPKQNPMYNYRESINLGTTELSRVEVRRVLIQLSRDWPGLSYDLLGHNCNHFCDDFCQRLGSGAGRVPLWVNRFANAGDVAVDVASSTVDQFQRLQSNLSLGAKVAYKYIFGGADVDEGKEEQSDDEGSPSRATTSPSAQGTTGKASKKEGEKSNHRTGEARDASPPSSSSDKDGRSTKAPASSAASSGRSLEESSSTSAPAVLGMTKGGAGSGCSPKGQEKLGSPDRTGSPQSVLSNAAEEGGSWRHYFPLLRTITNTNSSGGAATVNN